MENDIINLIDPVEWEDNHIQSHQQVNDLLRVIYGKVVALEEKIAYIAEKQKKVDKLGGWLSIQYSNAVKDIMALITTSKHGK